jgi:4-hydroxy-2-oxoheptanedioate aldolase
MQMRPSRVLQKLRAGEVVNCFKLNLSCPRTADLVAAAAFDCIWVDLEHTATDWDTLEKQVYAAKSRDVDVMARCSRGGYSDYIRCLELDSAGIMVPHIMNLEDAKRVVWMTRFHPVGRRPFDGGNADGIYCRVSAADYIKQANEQRFLVVQIEDPEPLDDLDAIAALDGIDMIFFGPGDFSHSIGHPGEFSHPLVVETRKRVGEAARKHGKWAGTLGSPETMPDLVKLGYTFINIGADVIGLNSYCDQLVSDWKSKLPK